jgi:hypothetical protein
MRNSRCRPSPTSLRDDEWYCYRYFWCSFFCSLCISFFLSVFVMIERRRECTGWGDYGFPFMIMSRGGPSELAPVPFSELNIARWRTSRVSLWLISPTDSLSLSLSLSIYCEARGEWICLGVWERERRRRALSDAVNDFQSLHSDVDRKQHQSSKFADSLSLGFGLCRVVRRRARAGNDDALHLSMEGSMQRSIARLCEACAQHTTRHSSSDPLCLSLCLSHSDTHTLSLSFSFFSNIERAG